ETATTYRAWERLQELVDEADRNFTQRERERADVEEQVNDLKKVSPQEGEWEKVSAEHTRLQHGSSLLGGAQSALETLAEAEGACLSQLAAVANRLKTLSQHDHQLNGVVEMLESAEAQASEAVRTLRQYASRVDLDPEALREVDARIETLHAAARKYRVRPEALHEVLQDLEKRRGELELAVNPEALRREVAAAKTSFDSLCRKLSLKRRAGAEALGKAVTAAMQQLAMAGGRFSVSLRKLDEPGASGAEAVEFEVSSHPSLPLRPLAKVVSGGELSRISLAIQLVAAKASPVASLVFDEIDSGIGGAVAETIGKSLRRLGKQRQVLCVTHLPQVAASGNDQWSVSRAGVKVKVQRLDRTARIVELARMLGGAESTARKHAAELLDAT
ncbi:MAG TPA: DNA repair protein RecN, partial [Burkholderiales bacterium]|nr:DNA repair protein RecN [Burkholderiales bacterium]